MRRFNDVGGSGISESNDALREQLQIKSESLLLLSQQLENSVREKDEYKRLIDTLYDKNLTLKKKLYNEQGDNGVDKTQKSKKSPSKYDDIDSEEYIKILKDLVKTLKKEKYDLMQGYEDAKQELNDCKLDLKLLREQITRQRIGGSTNEGLIVQKPDLQQQNERETLIKEVELLKEKNLTLENDLKLMMCQKEEFEYERDSYKSKFKQLNQFLIENSNVAKQSAPSSSVVNKQLLNLNIDELISQNKYLAESNKSLKEEICILNDTLGKYKKQSSGSAQKTAKQPADDDDCNNNNVINKREIRALLKKSNEFLDLYSLQSNVNASTPTAFSLKLLNELTMVCDALLDNLNDKHIALQHQRKCNKLLATRIQDLECELNKIKATATNSDNSSTTTQLIKLDDDHDDIDDGRLCNLINDLASRFKINENELKKQSSTTSACDGIVEASIADADEEEESVSGYSSTNKQIYSINSASLNEPFILNT